MSTLLGTNYNDSVSGTSGSDSFYLYEGDDKAWGSYGNDYMYGYGGRDLLYGQDGNDLLSGMDGNDYLSGGNGYDYLYGGNGYDTLVGGANSDTLSGGSNADTFYMDSVSNANYDRITDFNRWEGDKINVSAIDAKEWSLWSSSTWGNNTFSFIGTNSFTGKGQINYFHSGGNTYVRGNTDSDSSAEFTITLSGTHNLQFSDFVL